jgi:hypothetical protein
MLVYIWMCVMVQAFMPSVGSVAALQAQAYEAHLRAELEAPAPVSAAFGAAGHVTRYQMPRLAVG